MTKAFDVILQGGGRILLSFDGSLDPDEMGTFTEHFKRAQEDGRPLMSIAGVRHIIDNRAINEQSPTRIITCDRSSGRYHYRYIEVQENGNERILVDERCQTDQSGKFDVLTEIPESADRNTLCRFCMPGSENAGG